jgi:hypothetical protein
MVEVQALADQAGHPTARWFAALLQTTIATLLGDLDAAEQLAGAAFAIASDGGQPDAEFAYSAQLAQIRYDQGRLPELIEPIRGLVRDYPGVPAWSAGLAAALSEAGRADETRELLRAGAANGFVPVDIAWGSGMGFYAIACARFGAAPVANALYERLAPYPRQVTYTAVNAWLTVAHHLGALARVAGRLDTADEHRALAAELGEQMGTPIWLARTRLEQARVRVGRGDHGLGVRELVDSVVTTAQRHGAKGLERDAAALAADGAAVPA